MTGNTFKETLLAQLEKVGRDGIRITPGELVAAAELVKHDQAHAFLNGFGYLCLRSS